MVTVTDSVLKFAIHMKEFIKCLNVPNNLKPNLGNARITYSVLVYRWC